MTTGRDEQPLSRRDARNALRAASGLPFDSAPLTGTDRGAEAGAISGGDASEGGFTDGSPSSARPLSRREAAQNGFRVAWDPSVDNEESGESSAGGRRRRPSDSSPETTEIFLPALATMTRRDLRALRDAALAAGEPIPEVVFQPTGLIPIVDASGLIPIADASGVVEEMAGPAAPDPSRAEDPGEVESVVVEPVVAELVGAEQHASQPIGIEPVVAEPAVAEPDVAEEPAPQSYPVESPVTFSTRAELRAARRGMLDAESPLAVVLKADAASVVQASSRPLEPAQEEVPSATPVESSTDEATIGVNPEGQQSSNDEAALGNHPEDLPVATGLGTSTFGGTPRPFGHWSVQAELDDVSQTNERVTRRDIAATTGAITTHALVLPSIPDTGDQLLGVNFTGELLLTGSVDLPRTFGSTGAHPPLFDHSDVDAVYELGDREDAEPTAAPVRAVRAVSSNNSTRVVIESPQPARSRIRLVVGISTGAVLLVAASVTVAGIFFNAF